MLDATPYIQALNDHAIRASQAQDPATNAAELEKFFRIAKYCRDHGLLLKSRDGVLTLRRDFWCFGIKRWQVLYTPNNILIDGQDGYLDHIFKEERRLARVYDRTGL